MSNNLSINKLRKTNTMTSSYNQYSTYNDKNTISSTSNFKKSPTQVLEETISKCKGDDVELQKIVTQKTITPNSNNLNNIVIDFDYTDTNLNELFNNTLYQNKISKIYRGYNADLNFPRVLIISHSGFIMEFLNSIRLRRNIRIKFINDTKSSALYILKIYCINCGSICYSKNDSCKLEFDVIIYNNIDHLEIKN
jgi:hypothetical protein